MSMNMELKGRESERRGGVSGEGQSLTAWRVTSRERGNDKSEIKKRMFKNEREGIKNDKMIK
jgi:hypothetical protein